jgi:hypothetical protein
MKINQVITLTRKGIHAYHIGTGLKEWFGQGTQIIITKVEPTFILVNGTHRIYRKKVA